jgi:7-cyano-7-deazaguanine synthase
VIVLLSGGQDSTTCLHWALERGPVEALVVDYGQRHFREVGSAMTIANLAGVRLHQGSIEFPVRSALIDGGPIGTRPDGLPTTFVPGRNAALLALAAGLGPEVVIGCSSVDYSGYPDCRPNFLAAQEAALSLALDKPVTIHAPLLHLSKRETVLLAYKLGPECWNALGHSWTCYVGDERPCGECPACVLRAKGFAEAGYPDPALEERA